MHISWKWITAAAVLTGLLAVVGCERADDTVRPASYPIEADIYTDNLVAGVEFQAFAGTAQALEGNTSFINTDAAVGTYSASFTVPDGTDPAANFAGAAFISSVGRDLSSFDAVSFYARASVSGATMGAAGLGNDNAGGLTYVVDRAAIPLTTSWQKYTVAIPDPSYLTQEQGLFYFAAGAVDGQAWTLYLDEITYESTGTIIPTAVTMISTTITPLVGATSTIGSLNVTFDELGALYTVSAAPSYFDFESSDESVATVDGMGVITAVGTGTATITASLGDLTASGAITVAIGSSSGPATAAPAPGFATGDVIALYSDEYAESTVDSWSADWDVADVEDVLIQGDNAKYYSTVSYAGIDFSSNSIDASGMNSFYMHVYVPGTVSASDEFKIKLVDFGADGVFNESGGDDSEGELAITTVNSGLEGDNWVALNIPFTNFTGLSTRGHIAQIILSGTIENFFVDNILVHTGVGEDGGSGGGGGELTEPDAPAPAPTVDAADVTSLFSNAYTNNAVDTWSADWDMADVEDVQISGNDVKKYSNVTFGGIEFTSQTVDASAHTHVHLDLWTPDAVSGNSFDFKLVDFGADGAYDGGDDSEATVSVSAPTLVSQAWVSVDINLDDFTALSGRSSLAQIVFEGGLSTIFLDNIYFYTSDGGGGGGDVPPSPAPTPTYGAGNVVSMFSDAYTNVTVDTWSTDWDEADVANDDVDGNAVKHYTNVVFAGVETTSMPLDISAMTHFRIDLYTGDDVTGSTFKVKLVDFGPNGTFAGGDDTEHELTFTEALQTGQWVTLDLPLSDFTGMTGRAAFAQLIFVSDPGPNSIYVDNVLFHN